MKKPIIITIIIALITGGAGFFAGTKYQQSKQSASFRQFAGQEQSASLRQFAGQGGRNPSTARNGFQPINGEIIESDTNSITVKLTDGSSKIVIFNDKTVINKAGTATPADLKAGEKVAVFGQTNSDGSVTAQNIQLNPVVRDFSNPTPTGL